MPVAFATTEEATSVNGPSPKAFLLITMVGSFFVDLANADIAKLFLILAWFKGAESESFEGPAAAAAGPEPGSFRERRRLLVDGVVRVCFHRPSGRRGRHSGGYMVRRQAPRLTSPWHGKERSNGAWQRSGG